MAAASFTGGDRKWIERSGLGLRLRPDCRMADDFGLANNYPAFILKYNTLKGDAGFQILAIGLIVEDHGAAIEAGLQVVVGNSGSVDFSQFCGFRIEAGFGKGEDELQILLLHELPTQIG